jgi:RHS repeat-associated protein
LDRVTEMLWKQGTSTPFGSWSYGYNNRGQRLSSTDITGRAATYGYDGASRLTSEAISGDPRGGSFNGALSYLLDRAGNRLSRASTLAALGAQAFTYNANDEISGDTFDANGNTTASGGHTYAYDFENRLVSKDSGAVTITHDCNGDRVAKTAGGVTTRYLVDELNPTGYLQVLEEVVGGAVQTRYTYGTSIVSETRNASTTPVISYYGFDAHGNVTFLTDATGAVTDSYDYDAWGALVASTGSTQNTRLYSGEEFDPDLGLINLRARQYSTSTGRFLTIDPAPGTRPTPLSFNRYLFANGEPIDLSDPLGLAGAPAPAPAAGPRGGGGTEYFALAMIGLAASTGAKELGRKNSCAEQARADEFAAAAREPMVSVLPLCPVIRCYCHGYIMEKGNWVPGGSSDSIPQNPWSTNDDGRSEQAASLRCYNKLADKLSWHPANTGEYFNTLELVSVTIDVCKVISK